ncbi:hypothetical protein [Mucilaginibacter aquariorum]|uniref:Uncharacterized protein n=1 Tax=Mucilaginibacter aquariorum TaxID=2967225 RepID=A0ABT1T8Z3_9SPHI|nr:hypothetical protein [Mucilaginibacter aquariorum]MCQ6960922.1 hypothetical protein [Mucilaginibacter aquariorum]
MKIFRQVSKDTSETSNGYILDFSDELLLLHETEDFIVDGYTVIPIAQIKKIRFNKSDRYFDKMMKWENEFEKVGINYTVNIKNWKTLFTSLQEKELNVIVECEASKVYEFTIGPIEKIGKKYIYLNYFDAAGYFDDCSSSIDYPSITRVAFDTQYINVFSKYTRHRKAKSN